MAQVSLFRVLDIEQYGKSRVLRSLRPRDIFACAQTCRYLRHLAFGFHFRDLTVKIYPRVDGDRGQSHGGDTSGDDDIEVMGWHPVFDSNILERVEEFEAKGGAQMEGEGGDRVLNSAIDGKPKSDVDVPLSVDENGLYDLADDSSSDDMDVDEQPSEAGESAEEDGDMRYTSSLEHVLHRLSAQAYMNRYVKSLELAMMPPRGEQPSAADRPLYVADVKVFVDILRRLPNLENLWLKNILLPRCTNSDAAFVSLRHLCIDVTYIWGRKNHAPPGLLSNLLTPFGSIEDLRIRRCVGLPEIIRRFPKHLFIDSLTIDGHVDSRIVIKAFMKHPAARRLRGLEFQDPADPTLHISMSSEDLDWAFLDAMKYVGPSLDYLGFGPFLTVCPIEERWNGCKHFSRIFRAHTMNRLCPDKFRTLAINVAMSPLGSPVVMRGNTTAWSECATLLWNMRAYSPEAIAHVHTIVVRVVAGATADVAEFKKQIRRERTWDALRDLEGELLHWTWLPEFDEVVVEFVDTSDLPDWLYAIAHGGRRMFPKLYKRGWLRRQDWCTFEERWHH